jgi:Rod binding domain-containing protein
MSSGLQSSLAGISPVLASPAAPTGRGLKAAREFESQLIGSLLDSMEKTFATLPGEDSSAESDNYSFLATHALSQAITERGGFGIASMIAPYLTDAVKGTRK